MLKSICMKRPQHEVLNSLGNRLASSNIGMRAAAAATYIWNPQSSAYQQRSSSSSSNVKRSFQNWHEMSIRHASSTPSAAYNQSVDAFPSIVIGSNGMISPQGPFAEAQAQVSELYIVQKW